MTISLSARSLFSSSRSCRRLFCLIICHLNEAASTTVMSSEVPSIIASIFEVPYLTLSWWGLEVAAAEPPRNTGMESVLTSCPFWRTAFSLIERSLFSLPTARPSSFWGVGAGLSKSRKSSSLSLSVSTRGGVFRARSLKGVDCIRSRSAGLEWNVFIISCYHNSLWNLHNHTSVWNTFLKSLFQVSIWWCYL